MIDIFTGTGVPLTQTGWEAARSRLDVPDASLWAIVSVETSGFGYLPDRRPKILYERHVFNAQTGGRFSATNPDISSSTSGGYEGGAAEYGRLKRAMLLDRTAALESASWGLGQVMGLHAVRLGYASVDAMVEEFKQSEDAQLDGCARFIAERSEILKALQQKDWARFAFFYNGKSYAKNSYDEKLAMAEAKCSTSPPDIRVRAAQAHLWFLGFNPKGIDGVLGKGSAAAITAYQNSRKLTVTGTLNADTEKSLEKDFSLLQPVAMV